jgi:hypothetical protein
MGAFTLKTLGEWDKDIGVSLNTAMKVSIETLKKTGAEALGRCIVMMAQAVRKMTPAAKKNRTVITEVRDGLVQFVYAWNQKRESKRIYKWMFSQDNPNRIDGTWENAKKIGNAGMAKRSWFWGLRGLPGAPNFPGKPYPGIAKLLKLRGDGEETVGYILENRIAYMTNILPPDYEAQAVRSVGNKTLGDAARRMEKNFERQVRGVTGSIMKAVA